MTAQTPETAPLTFQAPPPASPGQPNPIQRGIAWDEPITTMTTQAVA